MIQTIKDLVSAKADTTVALAREIWGYAELSYEETKSAAALIAALKQEGFTIEEGIADIPTAFTATFTSGSGYYKLIPFKKIQGAFHNRGKELDFYDVSIETALGTFSTDAFHIRNGKLQLGDITLTNDRGEETDVKGAMEHAENTFRQIGQDIKEIKEQIGGLKP